MLALAATDTAPEIGAAVEETDDTDADVEGGGEDASDTRVP